MTTGIFILVYSLAILVDSSLMLISDITLKLRFFLSITSHSYLHYVLKLPLIDWMVQRTSLMKPSGAAEVLQGSRLE